MADVNEEFHLLMRRFSAGDEDAARELVEKYGDSVRRAVRRVFDHKSELRSQFDSEDFAQHV